MVQSSLTYLPMFNPTFRKLKSWRRSHHFMANRWGNSGISGRFYFGGLQHREIKKTLAAWKKSYGQPRQHIKKQRHYLPRKVRLVKAIVFYCCHIWM